MKIISLLLVCEIRSPQAKRSLDGWAKSGRILEAISVVYCRAVPLTLPSQGGFNLGQGCAPVPGPTGGYIGSS